MSIIKTFSSEGSYDIKDILTLEGFNNYKNKCYYLSFKDNKGILRIYVFNKKFRCRLIDSNNQTIEFTSINYRPDVFFERYAMLLETVQEFLKKLNKL